MPKNTTPQNLWRKLSQRATKPQNSQKFSPSKVFHYTVSCWPSCLKICALLNCRAEASTTTSIAPSHEKHQSFRIADKFLPVNPLNPTVHFWLHHTAHCAEKIVSACLRAGSASAERVGQGEVGGVTSRVLCTWWLL